MPSLPGVDSIDSYVSREVPEFCAALLREDEAKYFLFLSTLSQAFSLNLSVNVREGNKTTILRKSNMRKYGLKAKMQQAE